MAQARVFRKALGGGMRQAGVLAAAGLIALEEMPERLEEDHANARMMAEAVAEVAGVEIDLDAVRDEYRDLRVKKGCGRRFARG